MTCDAPRVTITTRTEVRIDLTEEQVDAIILNAVREKHPYLAVYDLCCDMDIDTESRRFSCSVTGEKVEVT